MLLAGLSVCKTVSTDALQLLMSAPPPELDVLRLSNVYRIKRGLPFFDGFNTYDVETLKYLGRESL